MRLNKNIKIFINYFLGPLLFAGLAVSIYRQVQQQPHLAESWQHLQLSLGVHRIGWLAAAVLLMLVNWSIEARKWQLSVAAIHPVRFTQAFKAVLSGVSFSVTMPNRIGEYAGRIMYLPEGFRLRAVSATLVGSISQLLVTLLSGLGGLLLLKGQFLQAGQLSELWYRVILFGTGSVSVLLLLFYFGIGGLGQWIERWFKNSRFLYLVQSLKTFNVQSLLLLLVLSFLRFSVFICQYFLLFSLFGVHASFAAVWNVISVVFLAMAAIPTIALAEVGLKGKISIQLMGLFSTNSLGIALTSVTVWLINLIVPALAGSLLIFSIKVFKRKNETI